MKTFKKLIAVLLALLFVCSPLAELPFDTTASAVPSEKQAGINPEDRAERKRLAQEKAKKLAEKKRMAEENIEAIPAENENGELKTETIEPPRNLLPAVPRVTVNGVIAAAL